MSILEFDDGIGGRLRGTLHAPGATPGDVLTVGATRGAISPSPGGGSLPGAARWLGPFPFAFDDAGLADGIEFYTPTPGDMLEDVLLIPGWPDVNTGLAWDGTTPLGDVGYPANTNGFFSLYDAPLDMSFVMGDPQGGLINCAHHSQSRLLAEWIASAGGFPSNDPLPWFFADATPLAVWVSQDGRAGGAAPGAMQGAGAVYVKVSSPTPFTP